MTYTKEDYEAFRIYTTVTGEIANNVYYIVSKKENKGVLFDPSFEADCIEGMISKTKAVPAAIILTHGHFDHIYSADKIRDRYNIPIYAPFFEKRLLESPEYNLSAKHMIGDITVVADDYVKDGDIISAAGLIFKAIHTPGHTEGSFCYYIDEGAGERVLFSGDTLFAGGHGKITFPTGSFDDMKKTLLDVLFTLPDDTVCYPGHGPSTTIRQEKRENVIFREL